MKRLKELKPENKTLHSRIVSLKEKQSTSYEH